jgi:hypothetical protein
MAGEKVATRIKIQMKFKQISPEIHLVQTSLYVSRESCENRRFEEPNLH